MPEQEVIHVVIGAGGMGVASARRLGGNVLLADMDEERLAVACEELRGECATIESVRCDVTSRDSVTQLAERVKATTLPLGARVNFAGIGASPGSDCRQMMNVNLIGTVLVLDAFEPIATGHSVGICVSSVGGHRDFTKAFDDLLSDPLAPDFMERLEARLVLDENEVAVYAVSKRGVILQVEMRAKAWGKRRARLVSLSPGHIADTVMGSTLNPDQSPYVKLSALGQPGEAEELGAIVGLLASPGGTYITGCDILADGGALATIENHLPENERAAWHRANTRLTA